jgi:hypothetical protein
MIPYAGRYIVSPFKNKNNLLKIILFKKSILSGSKIIASPIFDKTYLGLIL